MHQHPSISSYLAKPAFAKTKSGIIGFRTEVAGLRRANPNIISRLGVLLLVWCVSIAMIRIVISPHILLATLPVAAPVTPSSTVAADTALSSAKSTIPTAQLTATTQHAVSLAGDPTGQILPPIAMAPTGTYLNNYAWGECTWYVAGRRQVPSNWGNANTWYPRAAAGGWGVGSVPAVGAIAWTSAGSLGHVALVEQISANYEQVYVSEMNYRGRDVKSYRWAAASSFRYIY